MSFGFVGTGADYLLTPRGGLPGVVAARRYEERILMVETDGPLTEWGPDSRVPPGRG